MKKNCQLIIISGHPAAGKTTLSKKIADKFNLPLVSVDGMKETFWKLFGADTDFEFNDKISQASFESLYYFIDANLAQRKSLIVEAYFNPSLASPRMNEIGEKYGAKLLQIYCDCSKDVLEKRFKERLETDSYHPVHKHTVKLYGLERIMNHLGKDDKRLDIDGKTYDLDTTDPENIDYEKLFEFIKSNS
jgi:predicted kinase